MLEQRVRSATIAVGVVGTLSFAGAGALGAQLPAAWDSAPPGRTSVVLRLPGKTVEVIGLRRWTLQMVQDSMAKYAPGESIASHACAAVLRYKLGFADASATTFAGWPGESASFERVVVSVVEPQDSARVRYRDVPMDTTAPYAPWADGVALVMRHPRAVFGALNMYHSWRRDPATPIASWAAADSAGVRQYLRFVAAHATAADEATAIRLLAESPDYPTRFAAVSVLLNFVDRDDRAVFALLDAITERDGMVKGAAAMALAEFARTRPRAIPWRTSPTAAPVVHAMLDGTGLFELSQVMDVLTNTGASPADAKAFLGNGGGRMLLAYLGAVAPPLRQSAHRLLVALKGDDLGLDPAPWQAWIATL